MMIIDDNDYSNPYNKSNDNKKTKRINNIIKSTPHVGGNKNNNNRNYKNVNNNHNDNNSNNNQ